MKSIISNNVSSLLKHSWGSEPSRKAKRLALYSRIYFIQNGVNGPIKIGYTTRLEKRLVNLQVSNPHDLILLGTVPGGEVEELYLHEKLNSFLLRGEWFRFDAELIQIIKKILDQGHVFYE